MYERAITSRSGTAAMFLRRASANVILYAGYVLVFTVALRLINPVLLRYDDGWIMLVSYSWLNGLGFTNFWVSAITSTTLFNWHGFVQPLLVAALAPCSTLICINIGLVIVGILYLAAWYLAVNTVTTSQLWRWALYVIGVSSVLQYSARPELVAALVLVLIAMVYLRMSETGRPALRAMLAGGLVGLAAVTSPSAGVFAGLGVASATAYLRRDDAGPAGLVGEGTIAAAAALFVAGLLLVFLYPYEAAIWLNGIYEHVVERAHQEPTPEYFKFLFLTRLFPMQAVLFVPLAVMLAYGLKSIWEGSNRLSLVVFLVAAAAILWFTYFAAIRIPARFYYFSQVVPALVLISIRFLATVQNQLLVRRALVALPVALFALAVGASQMVLVVQKVHAAPDHDRMMSRIAATTDRYLAEGRRIAVDPPLATAIDNPDKLKRMELLFQVEVGGVKGTAELRKEGIDVLLRAQTETGVLPAEVPGFRLVEDNFLHHPTTRFIRPMGLYFAVYEADGGKP